MGLFTKKIGSVFLKDNSSAKDQLVKMQDLCGKLIGEDKKALERECKLLDYGIKGEEAIAYELRNSGIDMFILQDICLGDVDTAQIDFFIVARKCNYILECKNLYGDICIEGDVFKRRLGSKQFEGIYSPVTQNQRHLERTKEVRIESKNNILMKKAFEANFKNTYKSLVVLANPKTVLMDKNADKDIIGQVVRADQLVRYIKNDQAKNKDYEWSEKEMREVAEFFLSHDNPDRTDYTEKYTANIPKEEGMKTSDEVPANNEGCALAEALKAYRSDKSHSEGLKAYYFFKDETIEDLVDKRPRTISDLFDVKGLGEKKIEKYGKDILEILKKY